MRLDRNLLPVFDLLDDIVREQLPFAASMALTKTAAVARTFVIRDFEQKFDRPKPSTVRDDNKGPLYLKTADRRKWPNDFAEVRVKDTPQPKGDPALVYLSHHIHGGARVSKRSEFLLREAGVLFRGDYAIPGAGARLDRYGNMSQGQVQEILSVFRAQRDRLAWTSRESLKRNPKLGQYFLARRGRARTRHLAEGIWQRYGRKNWQVRPVLMFVRKPPTYRRRIDFDEICSGVARFRFRVEFSAAMKHAIATRKPRPNPLASRRAA